MEKKEKYNKQDEFWATIVQKYEVRNANLETELLDLQERVDQMEVSMPAVMAFNMTKLAKRAPNADVDNLITLPCNCPVKDINKPIPLPDMSKMSAFSIEDPDIHYMEVIKELAEQEKKLIDDVNKLRSREKALKNTKKKVDQFVSSPPVEPKNSGVDSKSLQYMNEKLLDENRRLSDELSDLKLELKHTRENLEGPMNRELDRERRKTLKLEGELKDLLFENKNNNLDIEREAKYLKTQIEGAENTLKDLSNLNSKLKEEVNLLNYKIQELQNELINQKLSEANTIATLRAEIGKPKKDAPPKSSGFDDDKGPKPPFPGAPGHARSVSRDSKLDDTIGGEEKITSITKYSETDKQPPGDGIAKSDSKESRQSDYYYVKHLISQILNKLEDQGKGEIAKEIPKKSSDAGSAGDFSKDPHPKTIQEDSKLYTLIRDLSKEIATTQYIDNIPPEFVETIEEVKELCDLIDQNTCDTCENIDDLIPEKDTKKSSLVDDSGAKDLGIPELSKDIIDIADSEAIPEITDEAMTSKKSSIQSMPEKNLVVEPPEIDSKIDTLRKTSIELQKSKESKESQTKISLRSEERPSKSDVVGSEKRSSKSDVVVPVPHTRIVRDFEVGLSTPPSKVGKKAVAADQLSSKLDDLISKDVVDPNLPKTDEAPFAEEQKEDRTKSLGSKDSAQIIGEIEPKKISETDANKDFEQEASIKKPSLLNTLEKHLSGNYATEEILNELTELEEQLSTDLDKPIPEKEIKSDSEYAEKVEVITELEAPEDFEVETSIKIIKTSSDGMNITTAITRSGVIEITTEGPSGIIETTMAVTMSGNIEVVTVFSENIEDEIEGNILIGDGSSKDKEKKKGEDSDIEDKDACKTCSFIQNLTEDMDKPREGDRKTSSGAVDEAAPKSDQESPYEPECEIVSKVYASLEASLLNISVVELELEAIQNINVEVQEDVENVIGIVPEEQQSLKTEEAKRSDGEGLISISKELSTLESELPSKSLSKKSSKGDSLIIKRKSIDKDLKGSVYIPDGYTEECLKEHGVISKQPSVSELPSKPVSKRSSKGDSLSMKGKSIDRDLEVASKQPSVSELPSKPVSKRSSKGDSLSMKIKSIERDLEVASKQPSVSELSSKPVSKKSSKGDSLIMKRKSIDKDLKDSVYIPDGYTEEYLKEHRVISNQPSVSELPSKPVSKRSSIGDSLSMKRKSIDRDLEIISKQPSVSELSSKPVSKKSSKGDSLTMKGKSIDKDLKGSVYIPDGYTGKYLKEHGVISKQSSVSEFPSKPVSKRSSKVVSLLTEEDGVISKQRSVSTSKSSIIKSKATTSSKTPSESKDSEYDDQRTSIGRLEETISGQKSIPVEKTSQSQKESLFSKEYSSLEDVPKYMEEPKESILIKSVEYERSSKSIEKEQLPEIDKEISTRKENESGIVSRKSSKRSSLAEISKKSEYKPTGEKYSETIIDESGDLERSDYIPDGYTKKTEDILKKSPSKSSVERIRSILGSIILNSVISVDNPAIGEKYSSMIIEEKGDFERFVYIPDGVLKSTISKEVSELHTISKEYFSEIIEKCILELGLKPSSQDSREIKKVPSITSSKREGLTEIKSSTVRSIETSIRQEDESPEIISLPPKSSEISKISDLEGLDEYKEEYIKQVEYISKETTSQASIDQSYYEIIQDFLRSLILKSTISKEKPDISTTSKEFIEGIIEEYISAIESKEMVKESKTSEESISKLVSSKRESVESSESKKKVGEGGDKTSRIEKDISVKSSTLETREKTLSDLLETFLSENENKEFQDKDKLGDLLNKIVENELFQQKIKDIFKDNEKMKEIDEEIMKIKEKVAIINVCKCNFGQNTDSANSTTDVSEPCETETQSKDLTIKSSFCICDKPYECLEPTDLSIDEIRKSQVCICEEPYVCLENEKESPYTDSPPVKTESELMTEKLENILKDELDKYNCLCEYDCGCIEILKELLKSRGENKVKVKEKEICAGDFPKKKNFKSDKKTPGDYIDDFIRELENDYINLKETKRGENAKLRKTKMTTCTCDSKTELETKTPICICEPKTVLETKKPICICEPKIVLETICICEQKAALESKLPICVREPKTVLETKIVTCICEQKSVLDKVETASITTEEKSIATVQDKQDQSEVKQDASVGANTTEKVKDAGTTDSKEQISISKGSQVSPNVSPKGSLGYLSPDYIKQQIAEAVKKSNSSLLNAIENANKLFKTSLEEVSRNINPDVPVLNEELEEEDDLFETPDASDDEENMEDASETTDSHSHLYDNKEECASSLDSDSKISPRSSTSTSSDSTDEDIFQYFLDNLNSFLKSTSKLSIVASPRTKSLDKISKISSKASTTSRDIFPIPEEIEKEETDKICTCLGQGQLCCICMQNKIRPKCLEEEHISKIDKFLSTPSLQKTSRTSSSSSNRLLFLNNLLKEIMLNRSSSIVDDRETKESGQKLTIPSPDEGEVPIPTETSKTNSQLLQSQIIDSKHQSINEQQKVESKTTTCSDTTLTEIVSSKTSNLTPSKKDSAYSKSQSIQDFLKGESRKPTSQVELMATEQVQKSQHDVSSISSQTIPIFAEQTPTQKKSSDIKQVGSDHSDNCTCIKCKCKTHKDKTPPTSAKESLHSKAKSIQKSQGDASTNEPQENAEVTFRSPEPLSTEQSSSRKISTTSLMESTHSQPKSIVKSQKRESCETSSIEQISTTYSGKTPPTSAKESLHSKTQSIQKSQGDEPQENAGVTFRSTEPMSTEQSSSRKIPTTSPKESTHSQPKSTDKSQKKTSSVTSSIEPVSTPHSGKTPPTSAKESLYSKTHSIPKSQGNEPQENVEVTFRSQEPLFIEESSSRKIPTTSPMESTHSQPKSIIKSHKRESSETSSIEQKSTTYSSKTPPTSAKESLHSKTQSIPKSQGDEPQENAGVTFRSQEPLFIEESSSRKVPTTSPKESIRSQPKSIVESQKRASRETSSIEPISTPHSGKTPPTSAKESLHSKTQSIPKSQGDEPQENAGVTFRSQEPLFTEESSSRKVPTTSPKESIRSQPKSIVESQKRASRETSSIEPISTPHSGKTPPTSAKESLHSKTQSIPKSQGDEPQENVGVTFRSQEPLFTEESSSRKMPTTSPKESAHSQPKRASETSSLEPISTAYSGITPSTSAKESTYSRPDSTHKSQNGVSGRSSLSMSVFSEQTPVQKKAPGVKQLENVHSANCICIDCICKTENDEIISLSDELDICNCIGPCTCKKLWGTMDDEEAGPKIKSMNKRDSRDRTTLPTEKLSAPLENKSNDESQKDNEERKYFKGDDQGYKPQKEVIELQELVNKMKCSCRVAESVSANTLIKQASKYNTSLSGLQMALNLLSEKSKLKDQIIDALRKELANVPSSDFAKKYIEHVIDNVDEGKEINTDFDRTTFYESLPKPAYNKLENFGRIPHQCICEGESPTIDQKSCECKTDPAPLKILDLRRVGPTSLLIRWEPSKNTQISGYEICVNGIIKSRAFSSNRNRAILDGLKLKSTQNINLYAVGPSGRCHPAAKAEYRM